MSRSAFAQTIINKLNGAIGTDGLQYNSGSATLAMQAVANGITEYLTQNVKAIISYSGIIPGVPPMADPTVVDTIGIIGQCAPTGPSSSFDAWIRQIEANIIAGFTLVPQGGEAGVILVAKPFLMIGIATTQSMLTAAHDVGDENPQKKIWEIVCGGIMDWINTTAMGAPVPSAATHPVASSTGMGMITKLIIT